MNQWLVAAIGFLVLLLWAGILAMRGELFDRVVAMELSSTLTALLLVLLAQGFGRDVYFDLAVVTAVVSFVGTLFYLRFLESWL
ncbi:MAG TPA: MrpF/PhaF family protein [Actinomycetota bacterium]|nr:MrpF/PhaF family protein [Actinomycetota bacterium]